MTNDYCNNKRQPKTEVLFEIAQLLNVEVKELINENK